ncbi:hypothetical protein FKW77_005555 [Venturia effusa]|uniref:Magnesium transporter n=1 Tax=Venturia effusa TaxID=50376 RepID=A0A517LFH5_9PEZI|nr:hypothetical protein FKW77_005555 [Venturia effusa]
MGLLSTTINAAGLLFLTHAVYSSYEHSLTHTPSTTLTSTTANPIPADIVLEILVSTTLLCIGIVLASPGLRPIQWRTWACEAEKDERRPKGRRAFEAEMGQGVGGFGRFVEDGERRGFWDVRGKRKEFAAWVRDGSKSDAQL